MKMTRENRKVHAGNLADLGFSPKEIAAAEAMESACLYDIEPSDDLVERTIRRCAEALRPEIEVSDEVPRIPLPSRISEAYAAAIRELSPSLLELPEWNEFSKLQDLQQACLATIHFAHARRNRPIVMLDNHNIFDPAWWSIDTGFRGIRNACQIANKAAVDSGVPRSAVVATLRPRVEDYLESDIEAIDSLLHTCTSDLWWIPYRSAGKYQNLDCIVLGEERMLILDCKRSSAAEALQSFRESRDLKDTIHFRNQLEGIVHKGTQILIEGQLTKEAAWQVRFEAGIRGLLDRVIADESLVTCR